MSPSRRTSSSPSRRSTRANGLVRRIGSTETETDCYPSDLEDLMRIQPKVRALLYLVEIEGRSTAEAADIVNHSR